MTSSDNRPSNVVYFGGSCPYPTPANAVAPESSEDDGVPAALAQFANELNAQHYMEAVLWPNGITCPRCGAGRDRIGKLNGMSTRLGVYKCYACRKAFSVTHGTIFHSSHVPLHKWLQAIYLTEGGTKTMKPRELKQVLNVSLRTATSMIDRLGEAARRVSPPTTVRVQSKQIG